LLEELELLRKDTIMLTTKELYKIEGGSFHFI